MTAAEPHVFVDDARGGVWVGAAFVSGFLDSRTCDRCGTPRIYDETYDAFLCPRCDLWLEGVCRDAACTHCVGRPESPIAGRGAPSRDDYVAAIRARWPAPGRDTAGAALALVIEAIARHPADAQLWCMRGDLLQRASSEPDALRAYETAASLAPELREAWESIGYYHYVHTDDLEAAESAFRRATALGGSAESSSGLARVLEVRANIRGGDREP